jgi:Zn-dependent M28 family amino/carboxypeptidase
VTFDGQRAWQDVNYQVSLGPRIPDSQAHKQTVDWMVAELKQAGWKVEIQKTSRLGHPIENVVADWGSGNPWILLGAHYDSRMRADQDPSPALRSQPVPGANDGASGVAVLLELARLLPSHLKGAGGASRVTLVFFDAEDNGDLPGWDWILGSQAYAAQLSEKPDAAVVLDMIGDANLDIYMERNSDSTLNDQIWAAAQQDGYAQQFIPQYKFSMLDDHIPFRDAGIPSVDLIDFDYPYWHTTGDTPDKVSAQSLKAVGDTLVTWLAKPR